MEISAVQFQVSNPKQGEMYLLGPDIEGGFSKDHQLVFCFVKQFVGKSMITPCLPSKLELKLDIFTCFKNERLAQLANFLLRKNGV